MNREIKFRAWDKKDKTMRSVYGIYYEEWRKDKRIRTETEVKLFCSEVNHGLSSFTRPLTEVELMQYTGLKDRHGKEIYEGDIVSGSGLGVVEYDLEHLHCGFVMNRGKFDSQKDWVSMPLGIPSNIVVIGNVHENPELLS